MLTVIAAIFHMNENRETVLNGTVKKRIGYIKKGIHSTHVGMCRYIQSTFIIQTYCVHHAVCAGICNLPSLMEIDVTNNHLAELPNNIGHLSRLVVLKARYNKIEQLPTCE